MYWSMDLNVDFVFPPSCKIVKKINAINCLIH